VSGAADAVTLSVHQAENGVVFRVTDRGSGMAPDTLAQATSPFFTTKEQGRGMGLGLFLVNAFALSVSGELRIDSTQGAGTRVDLIIPAPQRPPS
jgi:signal transduction histidine kinase